MVKLVTVSLRKDEVDAINALLQENPKFESRHAVIKLAIRRMLFPHQLADIPLDGHTVTINPATCLGTEMHGEYFTFKKSPLELEEEQKRKAIEEKKAKARIQADKDIDDLASGVNHDLFHSKSNPQKGCPYCEREKGGK